MEKQLQVWALKGLELRKPAFGVYEKMSSNHFAQVQWLARAFEFFCETSGTDNE